MSIVKQYIFLIVNLSFISFFSISEPLIILEYSHNKNHNQGMAGKDHKNENYSTYHKVKKNESLSNIIQKYYGNKGLNLSFVQSAILYKNKSAFVRSNPNFMFAHKSLYLPSVNEIKELIYKDRKTKNMPEDMDKNKEIYFFGN